MPLYQGWEWYFPTLLSHSDIFSVGSLERFWPQGERSIARFLGEKRPKRSPKERLWTILVIFRKNCILKMQQKAKIWIYKVKSFSGKFFREVIEGSNPKKLFSGKIFWKLQYKRKWGYIGAFRYWRRQKIMISSRYKGFLP